MVMLPPGAHLLAMLRAVRTIGQGGLGAGGCPVRKLPLAFPAQAHSTKCPTTASWSPALPGGHCMAIIARFSFDVPFGKKVDLFQLMKGFEPLEKDLGFPKPQILVGSIGAPESRVELNHTFPSLAALEAVWAKLNDPRMAEYQKDLAPFVVPGSHRWEIFRVQEV